MLKTGEVSSLWHRGYEPETVHALQACRHWSANVGCAAFRSGNLWRTQAYDNTDADAFQRDIMSIKLLTCLLNASASSSGSVCTKVVQASCQRTNQPVYSAEYTGWI